MEYRHLVVESRTREMCESSESNEFCRLVIRLKRGIKVTETMQFIQKHEVSHEKRVTYARCVCDYIPQKEEKEETRITVGGDRLDYQG